MIDYQSLLYDPIYLVQGVPASLTLVGGSVFGVTVLDKTSGIDIGDSTAQVQTIKPAAVVRVAELRAAGIVAEYLPKASITFSGFQWKITSTRLRPSPNGENDGELFLILTAKVAVEDPSESESESVT